RPQLTYICSLSSYRPHRHLHSFPTRRSSDLRPTVLETAALPTELHPSERVEGPTRTGNPSPPPLSSGRQRPAVAAGGADSPGSRPGLSGPSPGRPSATPPAPRWPRPARG